MSTDWAALESSGSILSHESLSAMLVADSAQKETHLNAAASMTHIPTY